MNQRIVRIMLARGLDLAGQYDRAHLQRRGLEIGDREVSLKCSHTPALVFTYDNLQVKLSRRQQQSIVVLNVLALHFVRRIHREFHGVTNTTRRKFLLVRHQSEHIQGRLVLIATPDEWNLGTGDDQRNRHIIFVVGNSEVSGGKIKR